MGGTVALSEGELRTSICTEIEQKSNNKQEQYQTKQSTMCQGDTKQKNGDNLARPQMQNYITQDEADTPSTNNRSKGRTARTLTSEFILACMDTTESPETPRNLTMRNFSLKLLCEFVGAVMDGKTG